MEPRRFAVDDGRPGHHHRDSVGLDTGHRVPAGCRGRGHDERDLRDYTAGLVAEQPDRFGFFVTIAMLHIDESVAEVVRSLEEPTVSCCWPTTPAPTSGPDDQDHLFAALDAVRPCVDSPRRPPRARGVRRPVVNPGGIFWGPLRSGQPSSWLQRRNFPANASTDQYHYTEHAFRQASAFCACVDLWPRTRAILPI